MNVSVVSFATPEFESLQEEMDFSAKEYGINSFFSFKKRDLLKTSFYERNIQFFNQERGFGFWLWKPYFILEALNKINYGDILFYLDSGCLFINGPEPLITIAKENEHGIIAFDAKPLTNAQFTKRDTFINLNCDAEDFWEAYHAIATVIVFKKTDFAVSFVKEWLRCCENIDSLSNYPNKNQKSNLSSFIEHREDQSIFSILLKKHNITTYRNPSLWGNFLKKEEFREKDEIVSYPYLLNDSITTYSENPELNSSYKTIFIFNRKRKIKSSNNFYEKYFKKIHSFFRG